MLYMDTVLRGSNRSEETGINMVDTAGLSMPDPEVLGRKKSRHFTAQYKIRILAEVDGCKLPVEPNPLAGQVARLEKENRRLTERLKRAETIIEFQKKLQRCWAFRQSRPHECSDRSGA